MSITNKSSTPTELHQKMIQEEEWLKLFKENLSKSDTTTTNLNSTLNELHNCIDQLLISVSSLSNKTKAMHCEQQNMNKLLTIVETTLQFQNKMVNFENIIGDGRAAHFPIDYIEKMNGLKEAISFFSSQSGHSVQPSHLKRLQQLYQTGCGNLESEFIKLMKSNAVVIDVAKIIENLDENYDLRKIHPTDIFTLRETQKLHQIASWLLTNTRCSHFLKIFVHYRSEVMIKLLQSIIDQCTTYTAYSLQKPKSFTKAKIHQKSVEDLALQNLSPQAFLLSLATLLALIQAEEKTMSTIFSDPKVEAQIFCEVVSQPLLQIFSIGIKTVGSFIGDLEGILPLAKITIQRRNQLTNLSKNVSGDGINSYNQFHDKLMEKVKQIISDYVNHLASDERQVIPDDGNVHSITTQSINFLKSLAKNNKIINYVYNGQSPHDVTYLKSLLEKTLSSLEVSLRYKSSLYSDQNLGILFMLNNLNFIQLTLPKEATLSKMLEDSPEIIKGIYSEMNSLIEQYMKSWTRLAVLLASNERTTKSIYSLFNKEFENIIESHRNFCIADESLAFTVRNKIKRVILPPFIDFVKRNANEPEHELDRQVRYDAESIELIIDRIFDAV